MKRSAAKERSLNFEAFHFAMNSCGDASTTLRFALAVHADQQASVRGLDAFFMNARPLGVCSSVCVGPIPHTAGGPSEAVEAIPTHPLPTEVINRNPSTGPKFSDMSDWIPEVRSKED